MKKLFVSLRNLINRRSLVTIALMFIFLSSSYFAVSFFGINNSSFCYLEQNCHKLQDDLGSFVHIRYYLGNENEGRIKSAIPEVNSFNASRIKEIDRTASYVLEQDFQVEYNGVFYDTSHIIYTDYYSEYFTTNRISLTKGSYSSKEFSSDDSIYISTPLLNTISGLSIDDALGKTVKLSLDQEKEYIIRGVVDVERFKHTGLHIKNLFSDNFIMFNSAHIYEYNYTDFFLCTDDYYFADDLCEFEKKIDKSYLQYDSIDMKATFLDESYKMHSTVIFRLSKPGFLPIALSVLSVIGMLLISLLYFLMLLAFDFNKFSISEKISSASLIIVWAFIPMIIGLLATIKGMFVARTAIALLIAFAAITSFIVLARFSFFKTTVDGIEEENGKE